MKYIVAVSGGVDSVVLLDMLVNGQIDLTDAEFVVAHFDHGIRENSADDASLVAELAQRYGLPFEIERVELGSDTSEEKAREERYKFLQKSRKKHEASHIITAHHQDDLVETAIFNLTRGTGWRGLASLKSTDGILRPLLHLKKEDLYSHARKHQLNWSEDITNQDETYSRNYLRRQLIPKANAIDPSFKNKLNDIIVKVQELQIEIDAQIKDLLNVAKIDGSSFILPRHKLVMWPRAVSLEVIRAIILRLDSDWHPTTTQLNLVLNFCKASRPGKTYEVTKQVRVDSVRNHLEFKKY
jgi:tRNA(Ile)-lysidine synthetase-like protein